MFGHLCKCLLPSICTEEGTHIGAETFKYLASVIRYTTTKIHNNTLNTMILKTSKNNIEEH